LKRFKFLEKKFGTAPGQQQHVSVADPQTQMSTYITELRNGSARQMSAVEFWSGSVNQYPSLSPLAL